MDEKTGKVIPFKKPVKTSQSYIPVVPEDCGGAYANVEVTDTRAGLLLLLANCIENPGQWMQYNSYDPTLPSIEMANYLESVISVAFAARFQLYPYDKTSTGFIQLKRVE